MVYKVIEVLKQVLKLEDTGLFSLYEGESANSEDRAKSIYSDAGGRRLLAATLCNHLITSARGARYAPQLSKACHHTVY